MSVLALWCDACHKLIPPEANYCAYCGHANWRAPEMHARTQRFALGCSILLLAVMGLTCLLTGLVGR